MVVFGHDSTILRCKEDVLAETRECLTLMAISNVFDSLIAKTKVATIEP